MKLFEEVNSLTFEIKKSYAFVIEYPKIREIVAVDINLRILQHILISYLEKFYEDKNYSFCFLDNNYACRKNFGTHLAVLENSIKDFNFYLKLDIKSFFNSIYKKTLYEIIENDLKDFKFEKKKIVFYYIKKIIFFNYSKNIILKSSRQKFNLVPKHKSFVYNERENLGIGLPIGNLTSQFFANIYLNKLDYFVVSILEKRNLNEKYQRYMDDFIIYSNDKVFLLELLDKIKEFLKDDLKLELCDKKTILNETKNGVDFLGYFIKPTHTLLRKRVLKEFKRKIGIYNYNFKKYGVQKKYLKKYEMIINSYFGGLKLANSKKIKNKLFDKNFRKHFKKNFKGNELYVKLKKQKIFFNILEQYSFFKNKNKDKIVFFQISNYFYVIDENHINLILKYFNLKLDIIKLKNEYFNCIKIYIKNTLFFEKLENKKIIFIKIIQTKNKLETDILERVEKI